MALPFTPDEFRARVARLRRAMRAADIDLMLVSDPANIYWLTGAEDWSFYVPQFVLVPADDVTPTWIGRAMDAPGARLTTWLPPERVLGYPETYVQRRGMHASDYIGEHVACTGFRKARIGYESDSYYLSPKSMAHLRAALPDATFVDCELLVSRARAVKSAAEIAYMREAAEIAATAMRAAYESIAPGARQCDAIAAIYRAQVAPSDRFGGDITALCPIILAGEMASTAHPAWSDARFAPEQTVAIELGGARRRYTSGLARTMHLGRKAPERLAATAAAVEEGMEAVLGTLRAGITGREVHAAWRAVLDRHGLTKESRIGYAIGIGFPPDWGEHTFSLRADEDGVIEPDMTFHVILGMWMEGWGMELSETVRALPGGNEVLTRFPRAVEIRAG